MAKLRSDQDAEPAGSLLTITVTINASVAAAMEWMPEGMAEEFASAVRAETDIFHERVAHVQAAYEKRLRAILGRNVLPFA